MNLKNYMILKVYSYNEEIQQYLKDNVEIDKNSINIVSIKDDKKYTSGLVESVNAYKYGYFEFHKNFNIK